jgi:hypothetical protein
MGFQLLLLNRNIIPDMPNIAIALLVAKTFTIHESSFNWVTFTKYKTHMDCF